ncbi:branched-chain amino acid ABC transporter permease [Marinibaculum pumilum]|uniref:Branched-chain amino acid ABC transporter permease n=1 Tax=Marinibaculum pumilum TaxID=1766165 RepID=A0ABV7KVP1_9PROT
MATEKPGSTPFALTPPGQRPGWSWWGAVIGAAVLMLLFPETAELDVLYDTSILFVFAILALSMGYLWGFVGILSLGQTAFFALGGYTYAVLSLNTGETTGAALAAIALPAAFAALLGYFMIYGRISDIYLSVITLVVTLILEKGIRATSGEQFVIGSVRLNGQNGIPGLPALQVPWDPGTTLFIDGVYYLAAILLVLVYVGLRLLLTTDFGRVLVGIRENERRVNLLGYDSRRYKLAVFTLCGGIAGLAGVLYAVWGAFVAPEMANLNQAALLIIWVIVGGRTALIGPVIGTALIVYLTNWLGTQGVGQVTLVMGAILTVFVLVFRRGLVPTLSEVLVWLQEKLRESRPQQGGGEQRP